MVLQLHEYLMRCLSDIHTSPHQRKHPHIMVQTAIVHDPLQPVVQPVRTEEHVKVHLPSLTVIVPVGTQDPTARPEVTRTQPGILMHGRRFSMKALHDFVIYVNLQTVVQPVRMEGYAIVHLPSLTVTVPVGTQETTARTEV